MFPISHFNITKTPFYYYDKTLLSNTLGKLIRLAGERNYHVHYAVKANANPEILKLIAASGIGADCVSGGIIIFLLLRARSLFPMMPTRMK